MASLKILDHFGQAPQKVSEKKANCTTSFDKNFQFFF